MSEYQYIGFRAIDAPVSEENLSFMRSQSTRAEITPWSFDNEYHFADFRGNVAEMLRRGYDFHLHYANFGIRTLMIRFPHGLPDENAAAVYFDEEGLTYIKDKKGPGGILCVEPYYEPDDLDEIWEPDRYLDRLLPLRDELLAGDLRPLYLLHLAVVTDGNHDPEEETEAPVPPGLNKLTTAQSALAKFYGLDDALLAAAAQKSSPQPKQEDARNRYAEWLESLPESTKNAWLAQLMADPHSTVRREILAEFQKSQPVTAAPTTPSSRTISEILSTAEEIQDEKNRKKAEKAARDRAKKLADMAADPQKTLRETEELVERRGSDAYQQIATLLADLREALAGTKQADLPEKQAQKLKKENPTLRLLTGELRRKGFVPKK